MSNTPQHDSDFIFSPEAWEPEHVPERQSHGARNAITGLALAALAVTGVYYEPPDAFPRSFINHYLEQPPDARPVTTAPPPTVRPAPSAAATKRSPAPNKKPDPSPSHATVVPVRHHLTPGMSAYYDGISKQEVNTIEHCGNTTDRVLLTFDDYSSPAHLQKITDILTRNNIGALFFPIADRFSEQRVAALRKQGFWVGDHTKSHPNLHLLTNEQIRAEITEGVDATLFRPPYGATYLDKTQPNKILFDTRVYDIATQASVGKRVCMWTLDTQDWHHRSAKEITETVRTHVGPGSVILMHMVDGYKTVDALPAIIRAVHAKGLRFCIKSAFPTTNHIPVELPCTGK